jgi:drug/metabolite transporter (DMT)-like permease
MTPTSGVWPHLWIVLTLLAVVMQSVRTAGQKHLTRDLSAIGATLVRFLFGLPFVIGLVFVTGGPAVGLRGESSIEFWLFSVLAAVCQIVATALLVHLFSLRNFAVGTSFVRSEAFLTALLGAAFFGEMVSGPGWLAILLSVAGVLILTWAGGPVAVDSEIGDSMAGSVAGGFPPAMRIGLGSGFCFALTSLSLRTASLSLGGDSWLSNATTTLATVVLLQTVLLSLYCLIRHREQFAAMVRRFRLCLFVGLTSALGSFGWFTAMTLERASYVKALGQVEFLLSLLISTLFFGERTNRRELMGMLAVAGGVLVLVLYG